MRFCHIMQINHRSAVKIGPLHLPLVLRWRDDHARSSPIAKEVRDLPSIHCADAGATCKVPISAPTKDELMEKLVDHLINDHNIRPPTKTILTYLETKIRY